ncbi:hypothetical protein [Piscibacillus salipiscarius]|nr:hypothetical protein [Piscibacillus salipiscarius]
MTSWAQLEQSQPVATKMLQNSITRNRIAHAYYFMGHQGLVSTKPVSYLR